MTSLWSCAVASLDDALALLLENVGKLEAAQSADVEEILEQLKMATDSARVVRELVSSQLPDASWQDRAQLDALIAQEMQKSLDGGISGILPGDVVGRPVPAQQI